MKALLILTVITALCAPAIPSRAGESVTLVAENSLTADGESSTITLEQGDTASLEFSSYGDTKLSITILGMTFDEVFTVIGGTKTPARVKVAGPATIKMVIDKSIAPIKGFTTFDVTRVGTAGGPIPVPAEAGTTWQVILEASADLVNWTPVMPGDYPSSTPQRYFRTRLVKRA